MPRFALPIRSWVVPLLLLCAFPATSDARWPRDGIDLPGDVNTRTLEDGRGGAFVLASDTTNLTLGHLSAMGDFDPEPLTVARFSSSWLLGSNRPLVSDGEGGVFVGWTLYSTTERKTQTFVARVLDSGVLDWTLSLPLGGSIGEIEDLVPAPEGGAFVAWVDRPDSVHARLTRITSAGTPFTDWAMEGVELSSADGGYVQIQANGNENGNVEVSLWKEYSESLELIGIGSDASLQWTWQTPIRPTWPSRRLAWGDDGRLFVTWTAPGLALMVQSLQHDGSITPGWANLGLVVSPPGDIQPSYELYGFSSDGRGGAFVAWSGEESFNLLARHIDAQGRAFPPAGTPPAVVSNATDRQDRAIMVPDGEGGAVVVWEDRRYRQARDASVALPAVKRITASCEAAPGWMGSGTILWDPGGWADAYELHAIPDGTGGAIVDWGMGYSSPRRAQRIRGDGVLGPEVQGSGAAPRFEMSGPFPQPFTTSTRCDFRLAAPGEARVDVIDLGGRRIATPLASQRLEAGWHQVRWDGDDSRGVPSRSGIYFMRIGTPEGSRTTRLVKIR